MNKQLLRIKNLESKSKTKYVYKDITFSGASGEIIGLLGHNGAGKSTMLRNIANLEVPLGGEVYIDGKKNDINLFNPDVVLIPDEIKMVKSFTIQKQIEMVTTNYGYDEKFVSKYLKSLKLNLDDKIGELSKGNQEILQLVILLSLNAKVILLDEPFSAVDIFRREVIIKMLIETAVKEDKLIIVTTHLIGEIESVLSKVIYLDNGEIIMNIDIEEVQKKDLTLVEYLKDYFSTEEVL